MLTSTQLTSTRFNQTDHDYFQKNFEVIDTNVSSLDEADTILLGEAHTNITNKIKNCWLLNKITDDNDSIYMEGYFEDSTITREIFEKQYLYPIFKNVKYKTWDCQNTTKNFIILLTNIYFNFDFLNIITQKINKNLLSDKEKTDTIKKLNTLYSESEILQEMNQLLLNNVKLEFNCLKIPSLVNQLNLISSHSINISGKELDALLNLAIFSVLEILKLWIALKPIGIDFYKRQFCCSEKLRQEEGKFAGIFGKAHLKADVACFETVAKNVELLMETAKKKKYVILFPTENREDIKYIEDFFPSSTKSDLKKVNYIAMGVFLAIIIGLSGDIKLTLLIISAIAICRCIKALNDSLDETPETFSPYKLPEKISELSEQYYEKVKLIPEEVMSKINSKYLELQNKFKDLKEIEPVNPKKTLVVNDL